MLTWCTVTIQSQICASDSFSTSPSHLHNVSDFDQTLFFPPFPLFGGSFPLFPSRTWPYSYLSNSSQDKLAEKFLKKSYEAPLITDSTNLIKQFFWKIKRGKNMLEKYLWVYVFFQHLLSELSWLCLIHHLEAYIKEIWCNDLWAETIFMLKFELIFSMVLLLFTCKRLCLIHSIQMISDFVPVSNINCIWIANDHIISF